MGIGSAEKVGLWVFRYGYLTFYSILGTLARLGIVRLISFEGPLGGGILWANFAGSLLMGISKSWTGAVNSVLDNDRNYKSIYGATYTGIADIPVYVGLTTGFYGSFTSFSTFIEVLFNVSAHNDIQDIGVYKNPGYGVMAFLAYMIITLSVSIGGYKIGVHIWQEILKELIVPLHSFEGVLDILTVFLGFAGWIVVLVLAIVKESDQWRYWTLACLFAPVGVYLRYQFSLWWNKISKKFFVGTFVANMIGTIVLSIILLLQTGTLGDNHKPIITNKVKCMILSGFRDGFCGSLTTVSTFVSELVTMDTFYAYIYGLVSIALGYIFMVLIYGVYIWVKGASPAVCT